jgi:hypothetical protein
MCSCTDVPVNVMERGAEDVKTWMDRTLLPAVKRAHQNRSPRCVAGAVDLKIPMTGRPIIGGPISH